jgi:hypothetical protein
MSTAVKCERGQFIARKLTVFQLFGGELLADCLPLSALLNLGQRPFRRLAHRLRRVGGSQLKCADHVLCVTRKFSQRVRGLAPN